MPIGILATCSGVLLGSLLGCWIGGKLPDKLKTDLNILLGFCSISIGITSIIRVHAMAPVVLAVLLGYLIGGLINLEGLLIKGLGLLLRRLPLPRAEGFDMDRYVTATVLFCFSGFAIYGVLVEAMSGDSSILLSKAVLDVATALIFAITLSYAMVIIPVPMLGVLLAVFGLGKWIAPLVDETMLRDFIACGGILTVAAGMRVASIKNTAITNLIPALILVMPLSRLWDLLWQI